MQTIKIDIPFKEQDNRSIFTFTQPGRIGLILQGKASQAILFHKPHFAFGTNKSGRTVKSSNYGGIYTGQEFRQLFTLSENVDGTSRTVY